MYQYLSLIFFITIFFNVSAQSNQQIDSLTQLISTSEGTKKVLLLNELSEVYLQINPEKSIAIAKKTLNLTNDPLVKADAQYKIGVAHYMKGDYKTALEYYSQALNVYQQFDKSHEIADMNNAIGVSYRNLGYYENSIASYQKAYKTFKKLNNKEGMAESYLNMSNVYTNQDDYKKAFEYSQKSLKIFKEINKSRGIMYNLNSMGIILYKWGKYDEALKYFEEFYEICTKNYDENSHALLLNNLGMVYAETNKYELAIKYYKASYDIHKKMKNMTGVATSINNTGEVYLKWKKYDTALEYFTNSLIIFEKSEDKQSIATTIMNIGNAYKLMHRYNEALYNFNKSLIVAKELSSFSLIIEIYKNIYEVYSEIKDHQNALFFLQKQFSLKDSLFNSEKHKQITELKIKYESDKKENDLTILKNENEIAKLQISKSKLVNYLFSGGFILITILVFLLIKQSRLRAKKEASELKQKLLRSQMNPHFIFNTLIAIQSFFYKKNIEDAAKYLSGFAKLTRLILDNSREEYISLENEIKTLTHYLELQELRFQDKFEYFIDVNAEIDIDAIVVPPMLAQPFIENAIEHGISNLKTKGFIKIRFFMENENLIFDVEDNGIGRNKAAELSVKSDHPHTSLATSITKERLINLNRWKRKKIKLIFIDLQNDDGKNCGTKVIFQIPFKKVY